MNIKTSKRLTVMAMFTAIGLVLQLIESMLPIFTSVPGGKLGLANIVSIINISFFGGANALLIATLRSFIGSMLYGGAMAVPYSVSGAVFSTIVMWLARKYAGDRLSGVGVGVLGAVAHNTAQILTASIIFGNVYIWTYLPVLIIIGTLSGAVVGFAAETVLRKTPITKILN